MDCFTPPGFLLKSGSFKALSHHPEAFPCQLWPFLRAKGAQLLHSCDPTPGTFLQDPVDADKAKVQTLRRGEEKDLFCIGSAAKLRWSNASPPWEEALVPAAPAPPGTQQVGFPQLPFPAPRKEPRDTSALTAGGKAP